MTDSVIRIKPHYYIHVLDKMTNVTRVEGVYRKAQAIWSTFTNIFSGTSHFH